MVVVSAVTLLTASLAACSGGATPRSGVATPRNARQAIVFAVRSSHQTTSLTSTQTFFVTGPIPANVLSSHGVILAITMTTQLRPILLAYTQWDLEPGNDSVVFRQILTPRAIYAEAHDPLHSQTTRPWTEISRRSLPPGASFSGLAENPLTDPLAGNPGRVAGLLAAAVRLRKVGIQRVDGVQATEYSGILTTSALTPLLPGPEGWLPLIGTLLRRSRSTSFRVWMDGQYHVRKLVLRVLGAGSTSMIITVDVTSINQPVRIAPPPASQVSLQRIIPPTG